MIEGRAQCSDVSKLGLRDLKVTIFHPFCRSEARRTRRIKTEASHSWINPQKPAWKFRMWSKSTCSQKWKKSEKLTGHTEYSLTNFQYEVHPVYDRNWNAESYFEKIVKSHKENQRRCISGEFFICSTSAGDKWFDENQDRSVIAVEIQMIFETKPQFGLQKRHW